MATPASPRCPKHLLGGRMGSGPGWGLRNLPGGVCVPLNLAPGGDPADRIYFTCTSLPLRVLSFAFPLCTADFSAAGVALLGVMDDTDMTDGDKTTAVTNYIESTVNVVSAMQAATPQSSRDTMLTMLTDGVDASVVSMLRIAENGPGTLLPAVVPFTSDTVQGYVQVVDVATVQKVTYPDMDVDGQLSATTTSFELPTSVFSASTSDFAAVSFVELNDTTLFDDTGAGGFHTGGALEQNKLYQITSKVIMVELKNVDKSRTDALGEPACGTYQYKDKLDETALNATYFSPKCVFWNVTTKTWSDTGCTRASYDAVEGTVKCCCTHLTSFAVLVSGDPYSAADTAALEVITLVGTIVSLTSILLTIVSILSVRALRKQLRYKILLQMVSSLGLAQLFFAFVANDSIRADGKLCQGWSMMTLYFLLAYFAWMNVESCTSLNLWHSYSVGPTSLCVAVCMVICASVGSLFSPVLCLPSRILSNLSPLQTICTRRSSWSLLIVFRTTGGSWPCPCSRGEHRS